VTGSHQWIPDLLTWAAHEYVETGTDGIKQYNSPDQELNGHE
jgi:hypothetical protein